VTGTQCLLPHIRRWLDAAYHALARLTPPPQLARLNTEVLVDLRVLLSGYTSLVKAAKKGKAALLRAIAEEPARYARLDKQIAALWIKLGVPACND
jgi:hypothetical protein